LSSPGIRMRKNGSSASESGSTSNKTSGRADHKAGQSDALSCCSPDSWIRGSCCGGPSSSIHLLWCGVPDVLHLHKLNATLSRTLRCGIMANFEHHAYPAGLAADRKYRARTTRSHSITPPWPAIIRRVDDFTTTHGPSRQRKIDGWEPMLDRIHRNGRAIARLVRPPVPDRVSRS
jgi:hypothetical protein